LKKKTIFLRITRSLSCLFLYLTFTVNLLNPCFPQRQKESAETITITTYYPAPYGVYRDLQTQRLAVGDTNRDGIFDSKDIPANKGGLYVAGGMYMNLGRYKMGVQFMNLGEDGYSSWETDSKTRDTCDGNARRPYSCHPGEKKACNDVWIVHKSYSQQGSTGEGFEKFGSKVEKDERNVRKVKCEVIAVWRDKEELKEEY